MAREAQVAVDDHARRIHRRSSAYAKVDQVPDPLMSGKETVVEQEEGKLGAECNWTVQQIDDYNHFLLGSLVRYDFWCTSRIQGDLRVGMLARWVRSEHPIDGGR